MSKGWAVFWFIFTIIINAIISFWIGNRFYKLSKKDNHLSFEIRALRKDIEEKLESGTMKLEYLSYILNKNKIEDLSINNNAKFSIRIDHFYFITKNKDLATNLVKIDNTSTDSIKIVKELKDPNNTHKYTAKHCIAQIKEILAKENINLKYNGNVVKFSSFHFTNFCKHFGLKENSQYCYIHKQFSTPQYSYSQKAIDFIVNELVKDPEHILDNIKK